MSKLSRRDILKLARNGFLSLIAGLTIAGLIRFLNFESNPDTQTEYDLGPASNFPLASRTMIAVGFTEPPVKKEMLVISETDGCFVDGVIAATACTVGHRTLRVEDYGKVAVTCVNVNTSYAVRVAPRLDVRERASAFLPDEPRPYFAQLQAYQTMSDEELLTLQEVILNTTIEQIVSRPGVRVNCAVCGEEIMNERDVRSNGLSLCSSCAGLGYYRPSFQQNLIAHSKKLYSMVQEISHKQPG